VLQDTFIAQLTQVINRVGATSLALVTSPDESGGFAQLGRALGQFPHGVHVFGNYKYFG